MHPCLLRVARCLVLVVISPGCGTDNVIGPDNEGESSDSSTTMGQHTSDGGTTAGTDTSASDTETSESSADTHDTTDDDATGESSDSDTSDEDTAHTGHRDHPYRAS